MTNVHCTKNCSANQFYTARLQVAFTTLISLLWNRCQSDNSFTWPALLKKKRHRQLKMSLCKSKYVPQLESHSRTQDSYGTTCRLNRLSKACRGVNQNMWISCWWRWSWAKKKKGRRRQNVLWLEEDLCAFTKAHSGNQILCESSVMRWNQIKHRPHMKT